MIKKITITTIVALILGAVSVNAQSIPTLSPWQQVGSVIQPAISSSSIKVPSLGSTGTPCLSVSSTGVIATTTCGSGGGGTPAGSTGEVQFNNAGSFGANSRFQVSNSTGNVAIGGLPEEIARFQILAANPSTYAVSAIHAVGDTPVVGSGYQGGGFYMQAGGGDTNDGGVGGNGGDVEYYGGIGATDIGGGAGSGGNAYIAGGGSGDEFDTSLDGNTVLAYTKTGLALGNVGVRKIPSSGYALDVSGILRADSSAASVFGDGGSGTIQIGDGTFTKTSGDYFSWNSGLRLNTSSGRSIVFGPSTLAGTDYSIKSAANLALYTGGNNERMRILSTGEVGIGTTAPGALLTLATAAASNPTIFLNDGDVTLPNYSSTGWAPALSASTILRVGPSGSTSGGAGFSTFTGSGVNTGVPLVFQGHHGGTAPTTPAIRFDAFKYDGGTNRTGIAANEILTQFTNGGSTTTLTILGSGNVGIGTTSPTTALSIYRSGTDLPALRLEDGDITIPSYSSTGFNPSLTSNTVGGWSSAGGAIGGMAFNGFSNSSDERAMFFTGHSGKTTATVNPVISMSAFKHNGGTDRTWLADNDKVIGFYNGATSTMMILGNGNVGIGTTTPNSKLQIGTLSGAASTNPDAISLGATYSSTAGQYPKLKLYESTSGTSYGFGVSAGLINYMAPSSAGHAWYINGVEKMRLDQFANFGVGTSTPGAKVTVQDGDVFVASSTRGIILKSPDGTCARGTIDNSNTLSFADVACP